MLLEPVPVAAMRRTLNRVLTPLVLTRCTMNDTVLIVLIITIGVIVILLLFRNQLSRFLFKANREGIEAEMETHNTREGKAAAAASPAATSGAESVTISRNKQVGRDNVIDVGRANVAVEENLQRGENQEITVRPEPSSKKPKR